jgi:hypothetical protein
MPQIELLAFRASNIVSTFISPHKRSIIMAPVMAVSVAAAIT